VRSVVKPKEAKKKGKVARTAGPEVPAALRTFGVFPRPGWALVLLIIGLMSGAAPAVAQPAPPESPAPPEKFQDRINAAAIALRESNPRFKGASREFVQGLAEFVSGNLLFVLLHEMAHASITQMGLPVLGKMEDAADTFAALRLIRVGSDFSHRVLTNAAKGWFLADRRDKAAGDVVAFYDEHGLNQQRAYHIVCLMVGSDRRRPLRADRGSDGRSSCPSGRDGRPDEHRQVLNRRTDRDSDCQLYRPESEKR
jgi:hypothetical protein